MITVIDSTWYLLDGIHCDCDKLPYQLTTDGHNWAQCPNCLRVYQCACDMPEKQMLSVAGDGILHCVNCGVPVSPMTPIPGTDHYEEAW